jgi:glycosyltransferase involved in cell wall biosynthesis
MTYLEPFAYNNQVFGGTEFLAKKLHETVLPFTPKFNNYNCLIIPGQLYEDINYYINSDKELIIWLHVLPNQISYNTQSWFYNKKFTDKIKYIIVVSQFAKEDLIKTTYIDPNKIKVIYNFVEKTEDNFEKFKNVKDVELIHCSSLERGFDILLLSLKYSYENFKLRVYNKIDSDVMKSSAENNYLLKDKRIYCHKHTTRKVLNESMSKAHIFIYPATFEETFCLSQAEALESNCLIIYNDIGSLKEISLGHGIVYDGEINREKHAKQVAKLIDEAVIKIKSNKFDPGDQSKDINDKFSLKKFIDSWINLHELI